MTRAETWQAAPAEAATAEAASMLEALAEDPRRLVAVVGAPDAAVALATALAAGAGAGWCAGQAAYAEPAAATAELAGLLAGAGAGRPVVALVGGASEAVGALARELVAAPLHPRLLVVVPCTRGQAARLPGLAGGYPRASMLVALLAGEGGAGEAAVAGAPAPVRLGPPPGSLAEELAALVGEAERVFRDGDVAGAAARFARVAEGRLALGEPAGAARALELVAEVERERRDHAAAAVALDRALALWALIGDVGAEAACRLRAGQYADRRADPAAAARHYQAALAAFEAMGTPEASLERLRGDLAAALAASAAPGGDVAVAVDAPSVEADAVSAAGGEGLVPLGRR